MTIYGTTALLALLCVPLGTTAFVTQQQRLGNLQLDRTLQVHNALPPWSSWLPFLEKDTAVKETSKSKNNAAFATMDTDSRKKSLEARLAALQKSPGGGRLAASSPNGSKKEKTEKTLSSAPLTVQGGSLKTWSFASHSVERVQVVLQTEGRPLDADIELWQGPDNTPHKMRVYVEDGSLRPFSAVIETPRSPNTIAIRNIAQMEFPLSAYVVAAATDNNNNGNSRLNGESRTSPSYDYETDTPTTIIQGGALRTFAFDPYVESVQVLLKTDGRPLNARIELLQGPTNKKQVIELYTEDGMDRPFFAVIETPGVGNVVRVVNTATVEFPLTAWVEPYMVGTGYTSSSTEAVLGGDGVGLKWNQRSFW